jgi:hypothetical protein
LNKYEHEHIKFAGMGRKDKPVCAPHMLEAKKKSVLQAQGIIGHQYNNHITVK